MMTYVLETDKCETLKKLCEVHQIPAVIEPLGDHVAAFHVQPVQVTASRKARMEWVHLGAMRFLLRAYAAADGEKRDELRTCLILEETMSRIISTIPTVPGVMP